jgi:hypothetical protein
VIFDENIFLFSKIPPKSPALETSSSMHSISALQWPSSKVNLTNDHMHFFAPANSLAAENLEFPESSSGLLHTSALAPLTQDDIMDSVPVSATYDTTSRSPSRHVSLVSPTCNTVPGSSGQPMSPGPDICPVGPTAMQGPSSMVQGTSVGPTSMQHLDHDQAHAQNAEPAADTSMVAHPYGTRLRHNIHKPKQRTDGTITYFVARVSSSEPASHINALNNPLWR